MADKIDNAQETAEFLANVMIGNARKSESIAKETGYCLNCGEDINEPGRRWCDSDCRDDYQQYAKSLGVTV